MAEIIDALDVSAMSNSYRGSGSASYHPKLLLAVLVYGYAMGVFSSRKLERATYDSVAFRFIAANEHPMTRPSLHSGVGSSRRSKRCSCRFCFWRARWVCQTGHGRAGRHEGARQCQQTRALSYEHAGKIEGS